MKITDLDHKNICLLGYGAEGKATHAAIRKHAPHARVTIADNNSSLNLDPGIELITGNDYLDKLSGFDIIIKSPGIAWHPASELTSRLTSATQIFLDSIPKKTRIIGVTGTKGKSTTSNLIFQVLSSAGLRVFLAGNIGRPMLELLSEATSDTTFVLELSSYQLETLTTSPQIAVVTSFFPDHLDYHDGIENYLLAKSHIAAFQSKTDVIFYNSKYPECKKIADLSIGQKIPFNSNDFPGSAPEAVSGSQNASNLAAAYKVALYCGVKSPTAVAALEAAHGLPHRQESLGITGSVEWINDSAATTPESTLSALEVLGDKVDTILVGGLNRGYNFAELGTAIAKSSISNVILFPETGALIRRAIENTSGSTAKNYYETSDMSDAVLFASKHTTPGKAVLLSSASPSYNLFKNYPDRARAFKLAINNLAS